MPNVVPIIPLPEHVLLPASPTPYRIFDPAGRALVGDLLTLPGDERWLAVPRVIAAAPGDRDAPPPFHPIATLARLSMVSPLQKGDYLIVVEGLAPCRLHEVDPGGRPYRVASAHPLLDEVDGAEVADAPNRRRGAAGVVQATLALLSTLGECARDVPLPRGTLRTADDVVYRIAAALIEDPDQRQAILDARSPRARQRLVLDAIAELLGCASHMPRAWLAPLQA